MLIKYNLFTKIRQSHIGFTTTNGILQKKNTCSGAHIFVAMVSHNQKSQCCIIKCQHTRCRTIFYSILRIMQIVLLKIILRLIIKWWRGNSQLNVRRMCEYIGTFLNTFIIDIYEYITIG